jgi:phosphatidate cytidylyltransferase
MKLSETVLRFISGAAMLLVLVVAVYLERAMPSLHIIRWLTMAVVVGAIVEVIRCFTKTTVENFQKNSVVFLLFLALLLVMLRAGYTVGARPLIMLWLLMIIVGADVGGWLFGIIFGGDKMWEKISAHKTWAGQIGGIICGTAMSLIYGMIMARNFMPELVWVGISVSLLSQYGDLTASFIKRRLNIKDFSNLLPGHGGILDRFDGWIYVLPLIWFMIR